MSSSVTLAALVAAAVAAGPALWLGRWRRRRDYEAQARFEANDEAESLRRVAREEARRLVLEAGVRAREEALERRQGAEAPLGAQRRKHEALSLAVAKRDAALAIKRAELDRVRSQLERRAKAVKTREQDVAVARKEFEALHESTRRELESRAGLTREEVKRALVAQAVEQATAEAANVVRAAEQLTPGAEHGRMAKRLMGLSIGRFHGHYLTERHLSVISLIDPRRGRANVPTEALEAIAQVAGVHLTLTDEQDAVRLEGLDGVGREVARRSLNRLIKRPARNADDVTRLAQNQKAQLDKELLELGRKAFAALQIPRAHPEIVDLVGRLNYRTSFTQNQWKHAVEAAFLCGMMAEELKLDAKVARRAALMHDIGKALTHEIDGSHAVIGADIARRLGESELVANAIGAHHTDEPFNSPYAFLVAAADALSGARPGARRQTEDNYVGKIADLERIVRGFRDIQEAFAVQGGREVRVYVKEDRVDDLGAIDLSSRLAQTISDEMTFPGQIRVTVIREFRAEENAG